MTENHLVPTLAMIILFIYNLRSSETSLFWRLVPIANITLTLPPASTVTSDLSCHEL
jgi:hypothetical protein